MVERPMVQNCNTRESTFTVKSWAVVVAILGLFGWFGVSILSQEHRITKIETQFDYISKSLDMVGTLTQEIRDNQILLQRKESDR